MPEADTNGALRLPEEVVAEQFAPALRVELARTLAERGRSQREIAGFLGVTQAAVSNYLAGERAVEPRIVDDDRLEATVERIADARVAGEFDAYDALVEVQELLGALVDRGPICALHEEAMPALEGLECDLCVRGPDDARSRERDTLADVRTAVRRFAAADGAPAHVPNVGSNVASALPEASDPADVAAVPGRLHAVRGRIEVPADPAFGASQHVAGALLVAADIDGAVGGAVNLATSESFLDAARERGYDPVAFDASYEDRSAELERAFGGGVPAIAYHEGAFGIEPVCYVFGQDATDAVERALRVVEEATA